MSGTCSSRDTPAQYPLDGRRITIGREEQCDIVLTGLGVSRRHACIQLDPADPRIIDCESTYGLRLDDAPVRVASLPRTCVVTVGVSRLRVSRRSDALIIEKADVASRGIDSGTVPAPPLTRIGRDKENEICLNHPMVSRFHATVRRQEDGTWSISDHKSTNRTYVNGRPVTGAPLHDGDIVQIGSHRFFFEHGSLRNADDYRKIKIEAFRLSIKAASRMLLREVSFQILPGEFVAILGPSGAGKTTLARAMSGHLSMHSGDIYFNDLPLKRFAGALSTEIGFVAQQNLLRPELTVRETFEDQCMLRLPGDSVAAERSARIAEVMELLDIAHIGDRPVARLSGGEAKRVHVGIELLSSPTVIFLDEPLAGLDPGLIQKFMAMFRRICDRGHTLVLTTHTLEQIDLCDRILFVNNGRLVYREGPGDMASSFGVSTIAEVYEKARGNAAAPARGEKEHSEQEAVRAQALRRHQTEIPVSPIARPKSISVARQLLVFVPRYMKIALRDIQNLGLQMAQGPLIALLLTMVFRGDNRFLPLTFYFCVAISAIWIGGVNAVRDITREVPVFNREFRLGLSVGAYITAKIAVNALFTILQMILFGMLMHLVFKEFSLTPANAVVLVAGGTGGALLGLCISALSGSDTRAISWLPIVFIPQIFFSGVLVPFDAMTGTGRVLSHLTVARPVFSLFKRIHFLDQSLWSGSEWASLLTLYAGLIILMYAGLRLQRIRRVAT